ncbi:MAG TPA: hypothetical protein VEP72_06710 [Microbacterium sp.]|nr:hypothetical protein [Microbacterium sp.]
MTQPITSPESGRILRTSIWIAIGALIAAALVCVVWVLFGDAGGMVGKAFLTILLLACFAGVAIIEANLAPRRPAWFALASMLAWVAILLIGAFLIWMPLASSYYGASAGRFFKFLVIALVIEGVLWHARLLLTAYARHQTTFTTVVTYVTIGLTVILGVMLVLPLMTEEFVSYRPLYWRVVVALAILAAVGTALVPLVNALFAPKKERPAVPSAYAGPPAALPPWPTFADAVTPLPALADGSPDWNAYYTGHPSVQPPAQPAAGDTPWYQGYPPPPPAPPHPAPGAAPQS